MSAVSNADTGSAANAECQCASIRPGINTRPPPSISQPRSPSAKWSGWLEIASITPLRTSTSDGSETDSDVPSNTRTFRINVADAASPLSDMGSSSRRRRFVRRQRRPAARLRHIRGEGAAVVAPVAGRQTEMVRAPRVSRSTPMTRRGVIRCSLAAVLFGISAPAASRLAGDIGAFSLAGLLYLGAAIAVVPVVGRVRPTRRAVVARRTPARHRRRGGRCGRPGAAGRRPAAMPRGHRVVAAEPRAGVHDGARRVPVPRVHRPTGRRRHRAGRDRRASCWGGRADADAPVGRAADRRGMPVLGRRQLRDRRPRRAGARPHHVRQGCHRRGANLTIGLALDGAPAGWPILGALVVGGFGYGMSITLWVAGARDLGAARGQLVFATAPFVGAVVAWTVFADPVATREVVSLLIAAVGVSFVLRSDHLHDAHHDADRARSRTRARRRAPRPQSPRRRTGRHQHLHRHEHSCTPIPTCPTSTTATTTPRLTRRRWSGGRRSSEAFGRLAT